MGKKSRYEYEAVNCNRTYHDDEFDENIVRRMLNSDGMFCVEVIVTDREENKKYRYTMERKLIKEEILLQK